LPAKLRDRGKYVREKGVSSIVVIAVVIVIIAAVGVGGYFLVRGGGGPGGLPVYLGAVENIEGTALVKAGLENMGASAIEVSAYTSTQDVTTIASWYRFKMIELGWTKESDDVRSSSGGLMFERGNDGAIVALDSYHGTTYIIILYGQWGSIQLLVDYVSGLGGRGAPPSAMFTVTAKANPNTGGIAGENGYTLTISHEGGDDLVFADLEVQASNSATTMEPYPSTLWTKPGTTFTVGGKATIVCDWPASDDCIGEAITVYIIHEPSKQKMFSSSGVVVAA
jgi:hypothetical protein